MIYGYARVSTTKQAKNGNSLTEQETALRQAGAEKIVFDDFTGTKMDRPEFSKLREELQDGDTLIVTKLDRFARTIVEGVSVIRELMERGVTINILNMGIVQNTSTGRLTLSMMMAFAEFERDMIIERTQSGKAIARANGKCVDGRPKKYPRKYIEEALNRIEAGESYNTVANDTKISKSTLIRAMKERKAVKVEESSVTRLPDGSQLKAMWIRGKGSIEKLEEHDNNKTRIPVQIQEIGSAKQPEPIKVFHLKKDKV